jgi:hypothetical protein
MLSKALEMGVCFGEHGGTLFPKGLWEKGKFLYSGNFYKEFERYVRKAL